MKFEKIKNFFKTRTAKSIIVASCALLIGLAIYLNYQWFYDPVGNLGYGENNMEDNLDDNASVNAGEGENDYFASTLLTRQQSRDEAIDVLMLVSENAEASEEARAEAQAQISRIAVDIQNEANIESLVKAKGFEECIAVIGTDSVSVIVKAESLQAKDTAQILSIVYETTGITPENVSIINK